MKEELSTNKEAVRRRKRREELLAQGICPDCGKNPVTVGMKSCDACREKHNKKRNEEYHFYISVGICPICKTNELFGNEKRCIECRAKRLSHYYENTTEEDHKAFSHKETERNKERYKRYRELGLCWRCGKESGGKTYCEKCRKIMKPRRSSISTIRREAGGCILCGKKAVDGRVYCEEHLEQWRKLAKHMQESYDNSNHPWKNLSSTYKNYKDRFKW